MAIPITGAPSFFDPGILNTVTNAIEHNKTLAMRYFVLWRNAERRYAIDPYHLRRARGAWYLAARTHDTNEVKLFNLSRIRAVKPTGAEFDFVASNFDPQRYFDKTFATVHSDKEHHVIIEFSGTAAQLVRERQWHSSQKLTELPSG